MGRQLLWEDGRHGVGDRSAVVVVRCGVTRPSLGEDLAIAEVGSWCCVGGRYVRAFPEKKELHNYRNGDVKSRHLYKFGCVIL